MSVEDSSSAKIGVRMFTFCSYHSEKARLVQNDHDGGSAFILEQLKGSSRDVSLECYKVSG